jgi:hypothetical protein
MWNNPHHNLYLLEYYIMFDTNTMIKIGAGVVGGLVTLTGTYFWGKRNGKKAAAKVQTAQVKEDKSAEAASAK